MPFAAASDIVLDFLPRSGLQAFSTVCDGIRELALFDLVQLVHSFSYQIAPRHSSSSYDEYPSLTKAAP